MPKGDSGSPAAAQAVPAVDELLAAAVAGIGGKERPGQVTMALAVQRSIVTGEHLAVQAGTGTGKSLAYLVPAAAHAVATGSCVVVATATIALQRQLIDRDLPRLATALEPLLGRAPTFAILKGRRNYLCRYRLDGGAPEEPGDTLFDPAATSRVGQQVRRLHEWAAGTDTGDRDELVPGVEERAWRQVSVSARECVGAQRCTRGHDCFAEQARDEAGRVDIVVTNHALLAIDALEDFPLLPDHDVVVIDEAHDLVNRVTSVASKELSGPAAEAAARRSARLLSGDALDRLREAAEAVGVVAGQQPRGPPGRGLGARAGQFLGRHRGDPVDQIVCLVDDHHVVVGQQREVLERVDGEQGMVGDHDVHLARLLAGLLGEAVVAVRAALGADALPGADRHLAPRPFVHAGHQFVAVAGGGVSGPLVQPPDLLAHA